MFVTATTKIVLYVTVNVMLKKPGLTMTVCPKLPYQRRALAMIIDVSMHPLFEATSGYLIMVMITFPNPEAVGGSEC